MQENKKEVSPLYITSSEICKTYGFCRVTLWRITKTDKTFPKPVSFTRYLRYNRQAVTNWFAKRDPEFGAVAIGAEGWQQWQNKKKTF